MKKGILSVILSIVLALSAIPAVYGAEAKEPAYQTTARQMEKLNRGLIAVRTTDAPNNGIVGGVYLSWRLLGDESLTNQAFDIYRNGQKIHTTGEHDATSYTDKSGTENDIYKVVKKGASANEVAAEEGVKAFKEWNKTARGSYAANGTSEKNSFTYVDIPIVRPANVRNHGGGTSAYYGNGGANDASVGDLDGDGDYEIVLKWDPSDSKDSASGGYTGNVYIDAYEIDENNGGYMWRIDLGKNIRAGAHYTQFMVYDLDGDGKSEVAIKTAPGSIDGTGRYVTEVGDSQDIRNADNSAVYLSSKGIPTSGGEYLTIFDGETGAALYTTDYISRDAGGWGDNKYNRSERYLAAVAYLDGVKPSLIMCRGYYERAMVRAYDWDGEKLTMLWEHNGASRGATSLYGQGNHNLAVSDIDNDGRDEIVYGSAALDDNGVGMGNTYLGHGDAMHVSDFNNDGIQEVFSVKENSSTVKTDAANFRVAATGEKIFSLPGSADNGRGVMANIDDNYAKTHPNALALGWSVADGYAHDLTGANVNAKPNTNSRIMTNFLVYWDGDLGRELLDDTLLAKYHADTGYTVRFYNDGSGYSLPAVSNNGSKQNPSLSVDLWGDWREEIIMPIGKGEGETPYLRIFTSTIPTTYRLTTLMHDSQYRLAIAWQNVAYNQPPHQSYYIGSAALAKDSAGNTLNYLAPAVPFTRVKYAEGVALEGISLSEDSISVKAGGSARLSVKYNPSDATRKGVYWQSDDEGIATVSNGVVTGVSEGECVITATARDGGYTASCTVSVIPTRDFNALDSEPFRLAAEKAGTTFTGGAASASMTQESSDGAEFYREFAPYDKDRTTLSFTFNTGGRKDESDAWNWDGREYTFNLKFEDTFGNNILTLSQSYTSSAQKTMFEAFEDSPAAIDSSWSVTGTGSENPLNRSSTTWYVKLVFDRDADTLTASITGSGKDIAYEKTMPLNGRTLKKLRCYTTKDKSGPITVSPSLSDLKYTVTAEAADAHISLVNTEEKTANYKIYGSGAGVVKGALYNADGTLAEVKSVNYDNLPETLAEGSITFERNIEGLSLSLFVWKDAKPLGRAYKSDGAAGKIKPLSYSASSEPEAENSAKNAFDGNLNTVWASEGAQSLTIDLGGDYTLSGISLTFMKYDDNRIIPFKVSASLDGENWSTVYSGRTVPRSGDAMRFGANSRARYVKIDVFGSDLSGWTSLAEVEIYK